MRRSEIEGHLTAHGFVREERRRHDLWRHPSGVVFVTSHGARQVNERVAASLRVALRKALGDRT